MKIIRILTTFCLCVLYSNLLLAQTSVEGSWLLRDSLNDVSLFFRDDGVVSIVARKTKSYGDNTKMGTYKVEGEFIKIRWAINKIDSWKIKSINKDSIRIYMRSQRQANKFENLLFLRVRDEEVIVGP